jgi:type I restriction enzyme S subunit
MSSEWHATTLGEICKFSAGSAFSPDHQGGELGIPFIKVSDMNLSGNEIFIRHAQNYVEESVRLKMKAKLHPVGATVFAKIGVALTSNRRRLLAVPTIIDNNMMSAAPLDGVVRSRFLYLLLDSIDFNPIAAGTALPYLNVGDLQKLQASIPSLSEQERIEGILGALDDRITLLRETNATLEAIAQALFKSWFVDFDPVRAKMEGRAPEGMDEATAALFPDGLEQSALGVVPRGWAVRPIGDVVGTLGGATPDTKNSAFWNPAVHSWTTPKDLSGIPSPVLLSTERKISQSGLQKIGSGLLPRGTLLMSSRAPIGYLAIANMPVAINQGYIAVPPGSTLPPLYMLFWCQSNMENIKGRANGSTFMEISKKAFRPIEAVVPPAALVHAFHEVAAALFQRLVENETQAKTLATLRDTLLPRLISGQLRLPEAQTQVEASV